MFVLTQHKNSESNCAISPCFRDNTTSNGVNPPLSLEFTSAPCSSNNWTTRGWIGVSHEAVKFMWNMVYAQLHQNRPPTTPTLIYLSSATEWRLNAYPARQWLPCRTWQRSIENFGDGKDSSRDSKEIHEWAHKSKGTVGSPYRACPCAAEFHW